MAPSTQGILHHHPRRAGCHVWKPWFPFLRPRQHPPPRARSRAVTRPPCLRLRNLRELPLARVRAATVFGVVPIGTKLVIQRAPERAATGDEMAVALQLSLAPGNLVADESISGEKTIIPPVRATCPSEARLGQRLAPSVILARIFVQITCERGLKKSSL